MISTVDHSHTPLLTALLDQGRRSHDRFYMPGHKGGQGSPNRLLAAAGSAFAQLDLPELPALDQLFAPEGVIQEAQALTAHAFGAEQSFFLVNGSSGGLVTALLSVCRPQDQVIVPRNCHQSIIHGLILSGAQPIWIKPRVDPRSGLAECIHPQQLKKTLEKYPQTKAVLAVSPTYEGICGRIEELAAIAHQHEIPLIIDEAHGAHFQFHPQLPKTALEQGADLVVQSWHKVLGALSQASVLHLQGQRININQLRQALTITQSSSPNYLLLASLDATRQQMMLEGTAMFDHALAIANQLKESLASLDSIHLLQQTQQFQTDPLRLTLLLHHSPLSGFELDERLNEEFQIVAELPQQDSLTFVLGQGNSQEELHRLQTALEKIDCQYSKTSQAFKDLSHSPNQHTTGTLSAISPREAYYSTSHIIPRSEAIGKHSATTICPYPPGIPLLLPGEKITEEAISELEQLEKKGCQIIGCAPGTIEIMVHPQE